MSVELKDCPFCGVDGERLVIEHLEGTVIHPAYCVRCDNCGASSRHTDKDVREVWNERVDPWQPIDTAPKDGTFILLGDFNYDEPEYLIAKWFDVHGAWWGQATNSGRAIVWREASHWMPLPTPPEV